MYRDDQSAKMNAEKAYYGDICGATQTNTAQACGTREWNLRDEAGKQAQFHQEQANKAMMAASFLSAHPEFDEFIRLVRSGALQF